MADKLFRKDSLERLSSPDQLDKLLVIIPASAWIAVVGGVVAIVAVLLWSIFGTIPETTAANGIFLPGQNEPVVCYVPLSSGKGLEEGMEVKVYPTTVSKQEYGNMSGTILSVDDYVTSVDEVRDTLGDESLAQAFTSQGPVIEVRCRLDRDDDSANGFKWSNRRGETLKIRPGTLVTADIITSEKQPITLLIPYTK